MAKRLQDVGIPFDCFEMSDEIGGNWYFKNPNGASSCYQSLHIDTSKWRLAFEDFPVPADWPDFPHHAQLLQYFKDYVDHFGLREKITFNTSVERPTARRRPLGRSRCRPARRATTTSSSCATATTGSPRALDYPGEFDGVSGPQPRSTRPVRPDRHARQEGRGGRHGQLGMDIASRALAASDRQETLRLRPPRRLGAAEVHRTASRPTKRPCRPGSGQGRPSLARKDDPQEARLHGGLRPAQARPPAPRGAPVGVGRVPRQGGLGRHRVQAGDRAARRQEGALRRRDARARST